jgi:hypothetical protein
VLQKRKLLDEGLERKRGEQLKELYDGEARLLNLGWIMGRIVLWRNGFLFPSF